MQQAYLFQNDAPYFFSLHKYNIAKKLNASEIFILYCVKLFYKKKKLRKQKKNAYYKLF
jgi:hypothetical protein